MTKCNNCGKTLSCGCKKRTAKDGKSCCQDCVNTYNAAITGKATPTK
jgi:hypothetical protein